MKTNAGPRRVKSALAAAFAASLAAGVLWSGPVQARALAQKVFFSATKLKDAAPKALKRKFAQNKPEGVLKRSEARWNGVMVAFFRRPPVAGPITVWFFDKSDTEAIKNREAMHIANAPGVKGDVLVHDIELTENDGFNKNREYLVRVGQIVGKRTHMYASGSVKLLP